MNKAILVPNRLLCMVWMVAIILYSISFRSFPSFIVLSWVAVVILAFSVGSLINVPRRFFSIGAKNNISALRNLVFILMPFELFYILKCVFLTAEYGGITSFLFAIRQASLTGDPLILGSRFYLQINSILLMLCLYGISVSIFYPATSKTRAYKRQFYVIYIITMLSSVMDGSRSIFIAGVLYLLALNLAYGHLSVKLLSFYFIGMLFVFSLTFSVFRGDAGSKSFLDAANYTFVYVSGSVGSMQFALQKDVEVFWQDLESLSKKLFSIGLPVPNFEMTELRMDFVDLPGGVYQTNVFSAFAIYYQYFGYIVGVYFSFFLGWFSGIVYRSRLKSPFLMTIYSFFWAAIVLSVFHDYFLLTFYMTVKLFILVFLINAFAEIKRFLTVVSTPRT